MTESTHAKLMMINNKERSNQVLQLLSSKQSKGFRQRIISYRCVEERFSLVIHLVLWRESGGCWVCRLGDRGGGAGRGDKDQDHLDRDQSKCTAPSTVLHASTKKESLFNTTNYGINYSGRVLGSTPPNRS